MTWPRSSSVVSWALVVGLVGVSACGDSKEQSLCSVYSSFLQARAEVESIDPTSKTAADATGLVENYEDSVKRLRETDTAHRAQIDELQTAIADVQRTLDSVDDDAEYAVWAPLVEDSLEDVTRAADQVESLIDPQCRPDLDQ